MTQFIQHIPELEMSVLAQGHTRRKILGTAKREIQCKPHTKLAKLTTGISKNYGAQNTQFSRHKQRVESE